MSAVDDIAINENDLKSNLTKMTFLFDKMNAILNNIDDLMNASNSYMSEDIGLILRKKYREIQLKFPNIKQNLNSYLDDIKKNIINYQHQDTTTKELLDKGSIVIGGEI